MQTTLGQPFIKDFFKNPWYGETEANGKHCTAYGQGEVPGRDGIQTP
jgi:hypothetical protein